MVKFKLVRESCALRMRRKFYTNLQLHVLLLPIWDCENFNFCHVQLCWKIHYFSFLNCTRTARQHVSNLKGDQPQYFSAEPQMRSQPRSGVSSGSCCLVREVLFCWSPSTSSEGCHSNKQIERTKSLICCVKWVAHKLYYYFLKGLMAHLLHSARLLPPLLTMAVLTAIKITHRGWEKKTKTNSAQQGLI